MMVDIGTVDQGDRDKLWRQDCRFFKHCGRFTMEMSHRDLSTFLKESCIVGAELQYLV
jgi:hypothetical protein